MAAVRILIGEDNELVAGTLAEQLKSHGYEVAGVARNSAEVGRLCEQEAPDLLIMDMRLPETGGVAATELAERIPVPIVMMIAFSDAGSVQQAEAAGALAYLVTPVNPEELPPAIDIALARHRDVQRLRERVGNLQETLESRKLIERAKGVLMKRLKIGEAEAEERLRQRAEATRQRIQDIAQAIVESDALLS